MSNSYKLNRRLSINNLLFSFIVSFIKCHEFINNLGKQIPFVTVSGVNTNNDNDSMSDTARVDLPIVSTNQDHGWTWTNPYSS